MSVNLTSANLFKYWIQLLTLYSRSKKERNLCLSMQKSMQKTGRERQRTARSESEPWWRHQINWQRRTKRTRVTGKRKRQRRAHLEGKAWNRLGVGAGWHTCSELHNYSPPGDRWTGRWWDACQEHRGSTYGHWANNWEPFPHLSMFQPATHAPVPVDGQYDIAHIL